MAAVNRLWFDEGLTESPRISGSRISVIQLYEMHVLKGLTVTDLVEKYPALEKADVRQALRYAVAHPDTIHEQATSELTKIIVERHGRSNDVSA